MNPIVYEGRCDQDSQLHRERSDCRNWVPDLTEPVDDAAIMKAGTVKQLNPPTLTNAIVDAHMQGFKEGFEAGLHQTCPACSRGQDGNHGQDYLTTGAPECGCTVNKGWRCPVHDAP